MPIYIVTIKQHTGLVGRYCLSLWLFRHRFPQYYASVGRLGFSRKDRPLVMGFGAALIALVSLFILLNKNELPWTSRETSSNELPAQSAKDQVPQVFPEIGPNPISSNSLVPNVNGGTEQPSGGSGSPTGTPGAGSDNGSSLKSNYACTGKFNLVQFDGKSIIAISVSAPPDIPLIWAKVSSPSGTTQGEIPLQKGQGFFEVPLRVSLQRDDEIQLSFYSTPNFSKDSLVCSAQ